MTNFRYSVTFLAAAAVLAAVACGDDAQIATSTATASGGSSAGGSNAGGSDGGATTGTNTGGMSGCTSNSECASGLCEGGECCGTVDQVCGTSCCDGAEACVFDACVVPGKLCVSSADCGADEYCEPALGNGMGQGGQGANCTQPQDTGRCVPKPPKCDPNNPNNPPNCVEDCQYVPQPGLLNATPKWQWGHENIPTEFPDEADVWSTPTVARVFDANCDGKVDLADPPNVIFVSSNAEGTCCHCGLAAGQTSRCRSGVLRMLDGKTGEEIWSLNEPFQGSTGFAGLSVAVGDVDNDQKLDIVALSGEGNMIVINSEGMVTQVSTEVVAGATAAGFGWGGGIALGDMDNDGFAELAFGRTVFTMAGGSIALLFQGLGGTGGGINRALSHFVDLDNDGDLELLAGRSAYQTDGTELWNQPISGDGFTAIGDFDNDQLPEVVVVRQGNMYILEGATGAVEIGPVDIPNNGLGGPPTVADFNGDGEPEIGVAMQSFYTMMKPDYANSTITALWSQVNHDLSSSVTGSSVFDFEGDGKAEVVYMDECFVWVYDGTNGDVLFAGLTQSFTATEAPIVADVDGDGHAELVVVHNNANATTWKCDIEPWISPDPAMNRPAWVRPQGGGDYRGITVYGDSANSWVGTRSLWNQHAYSVTNICDPRDSSCDAGSYYGQIPANQKKNWEQNWLNNFRQNVQDGAIFDAADVTVALVVPCGAPADATVSVRNIGLAGLPAGIEVQLVQLPATVVGTVTTTKGLLPGQTEVFTVSVPDGSTGSYQANVIVDPLNPTFRECRDDNNSSDVVVPNCGN